MYVRVYVNVYVCVHVYVRHYEKPPPLRHPGGLGFNVEETVTVCLFARAVTTKTLKKEAMIASWMSS